MSTAAYYRAQAATAQSEADKTPLSNVRERCLRSVEAWTGMADRAERMATERARRESKDVAAA